MAHRILIVGTIQEYPAWLPLELTRGGHTVIIAANAQEATVRARALMPTAILMSSPLEAESAQQGLALLRTHPATGALPAMVLTPRVPVDTVVDALKGGVVELMMQPMTAGEVLERLHFAIGDSPSSVAAHAALEWRGPVVLRRLGDHLSRFFCTGVLSVEQKDVSATVTLEHGEVVGARRGDTDGMDVLEELLFSDDPAPWQFRFESRAAPAVVAAPPRRREERFRTDDDLEKQAARVGMLPEPSPVELQRLPLVRVLVVDDDEAICTMYAAQLQRAGMITFTASDGEQGYAAVTRTRPDVVLSDIMMPHSDGWTLLRLIRDDARLRECKVLFASCFGDYLSNLKSLDAGADDYLEKGLKGEALVERVRSTIAPRRAILASLRGDMAFGGSVGSVGVQHLLLALGRVGATGTLTVKDGWSSYSVVMDRGLLLHAECSTGGKTLQGRDALIALMRVDEGPFLYDPEPQSGAITLGVDFAIVRDDLCSIINARRVQVHDVMADQNASLRFRDDLLTLYLRMVPAEVQPVAHALKTGAAPASLLHGGDFAPVTVEWTVRDILRKGVAAPA